MTRLTKILGEKEAELLKRDLNIKLTKSFADGGEEIEFFNKNISNYLGLFSDEEKQNELSRLLNITTSDRQNKILNLIGDKGIVSTKVINDFKTKNLKEILFKITIDDECDDKALTHVRDYRSY